MNDELTLRQDIIKKIREIGNAFDPDIVETLMQMYGPLYKKSSGNGVKVTKDLQYGNHKKQILDVYQPANASGTPAPVLVFFHGGGFIMGDKSEYPNVGYYFAQHGIVTVNATYRLAPKYMWPSGAEDVAGALKWIQTNIAGYGGDAKRVFLFGHSAGAAHVAAYTFLDNFAVKNGDGVTGAILMSAPSLSMDNPSEWDYSYFGTDKSKHAEMSVIRNLGKRKIPVFIMFAEYDIPYFDQQSILLLNALYERDNIIHFFKKIIDHNHFSEIIQFNSGDESIGPDIIDFINSRKAVF
jgi:acetyl esterase